MSQINYLTRKVLDTFCNSVIEGYRIDNINSSGREIKLPYVRSTDPDNEEIFSFSLKFKGPIEKDFDCLFLIECGGSGLIKLNGNLIGAIDGGHKMHKLTPLKSDNLVEFSLNSRDTFGTSPWVRRIESLSIVIVQKDLFVESLDALNLVHSILNYKHDSYWYKRKKMLEKFASRNRGILNLKQAMFGGALLHHLSYLMPFLGEISSDYYYLYDLYSKPVSLGDYHYSNELPVLDRSESTLLQNIALKSTKKSGKAYLFAHAHIDAAWLWPYSETKRKVRNTFLNTIRQMENGYRYTFVQSSTLFYEWFKDQIPDLMNDIKDLVNNGDWILVGGMVVESDTNLLCGESLARQFYYGQNFFNNEFGRMAKIGWLPDTFGFSAQLPQLMVKSGIQVFATHKMMWNDTTKFPLHVFNWEGLDGSSLPTEIIIAGYNTKMVFSEVLEEYDRFKQKDIAPMLTVYGLGDGGGGVNEPILEWAKFIQNVPGTPEIDNKPSEHDYISAIQNIKNKLKTFSGEMYLEKHRGVYTTNAKIKRFISSLENSLKNLELLEALLFLSGEKTKKDKDINSFWKILLKNQFHDVLPGSANYEAYQEAFCELSEITEQINMKFEAFSNLLLERQNSQGNLRFFNPTQWGFDGYIDMNDMQIRDEAVKELSMIKAKIPPLSLVSLNNPARESASHLYKVKNLESSISISNGKIQLEVDKKSLSISVKSGNGKVLLRNGNILKAYSDEPGSFDAWEIELDTLNKDNEIHFKEVRVSLAESGRPRILGKVKLEDNSEIVQTFTIEPEKEVIKVQTQIVPASRLLLFKTFFKTPGNSKEVTCSVPFGKVTRHISKTRNPMFEFPVLNWLNVESDIGEMTIVSPHLHGYGYTSGGLSLTLAKFPIYPNPWSDSEGVNVSYWLYFHSEHINSIDFNKNVYQLLNPPIIARMTAKRIIDEKHNLKPRIELKSKTTLVESIRVADAGDHLVLRLYESSGNEDSVIIDLNSEVTLYETDIPETSQTCISKKSSISHTIKLKPFEIKTLCLYPRIK